jgi:hypothetical protein
VAVGGHPWDLNGHPWDLYGQPLEPEMGAFWSLMLLPMVLNVTLSGYGLLLTNMSQELFLPRTILLAVFGKEFFL